LMQHANQLRVRAAKDAAMRRCSRCRTLHRGVGEGRDIPQRSCQACGKTLGAKADQFTNGGSPSELMEVLAANLSRYGACVG
jgi:hypothetical protein